MGARKSAISVSKASFTDHQTPDTINGFRYSVLVCKMSDSYCTIRQNFQHRASSISIPSHQAIQATGMVRLYKNKPPQISLKAISST